MDRSPSEASGPKKKKTQCKVFVMIETFKQSPSNPLCQIVCLFAQQATPEYQVVLHCAGCGLAALYSSGQSTSHTICPLCARHGFIMKSGSTQAVFSPFNRAATCQHDFSLRHLWPCPHCFYSNGKKLLEAASFFFSLEFISVMLSGSCETVGSQRSDEGGKLETQQERKQS